MRICFDLDETLTIIKGPDYTIDSEPDIEAITLVNQLYDKGHTIIIHTARKMGTSNNNTALAIARGGYNTFKWLEKYGVKYHELLFGKPNYDICFDDKSMNFSREDMYKKLKELNENNKN